MLFPLIIFFTGIFATVDLIYSYSTKNQLNWLNFIGIFLLNLYGFFNSIVIIWNNVGIWTEPNNSEQNWAMFYKKQLNDIFNSIFRSSWL